MSTETEEYECPICKEIFVPDDLCSIDIDLGTCHAQCLHGAAVVDLNTGEASDGPILTFLFGSLKL